MGSQLEWGQAWAVQQLQALAESLGVVAGAPTWLRSPDDFNRGRHRIRVVLGELQYDIPFSEEDLEDAQGDASVRIRIVALLEATIRRAHQGERFCP